MREWPNDYPGGPLGQAAIWALIVIGLILGIGTIFHALVS